MTRRAVELDDPEDILEGVRVPNPPGWKWGQPRRRRQYRPPGPPRPHRGPEGIDACVAHLRDRLRDGPVASVTLRVELVQLGFPDRVIWEAKRRLGVVAARPEGRGRWSWSLPAVLEG